MSQIDRLVTDEQVIPQVESRLFQDKPDARFAVGVIAIGDTVLPGLESEALGYYQLRAGVYAYQTNMIDHGLVDNDGTEHDQDDERSIHFAIVENLGQAQRIVAAMRLIKKQGNLQPLPIEDYFPDVFEESPAPESSIEVSRYICRHPNKQIQRMIKWPLYASALADIIANDHAPTYAVIEPFLARDFRMHKVPFSEIAPPKFVPEYNDDNLGIAIDTNRLARFVNRLQPGIMPKMIEAAGDFIHFGEHADTQPQEAA